MGSLSLLQGIFPTQGSNPGLLHYRWILYQLSHEGSPRILEWVAYPFSNGSSQSRNWTRVSCIADRFFTNWAIREAQSMIRLLNFLPYLALFGRSYFSLISPSEVFTKSLLMDLLFGRAETLTSVFLVLHAAEICDQLFGIQLLFSSGFVEFFPTHVQLRHCPTMYRIYTLFSQGSFSEFLPCS